MSRAALTTILLVVASFATARAAGPYDDLLKHAPHHTNAIALIDAKAALASPLAKKEKWAEKGQPDNRGGLGFVPAEAELVAIASEVNLNAMTRDFQVGLVKLRNAPTMRELAVREGGTADEIAGRLAVLSPRNVYFTTLSGSELAAVYPADRQYTARWLKTALAGKTGDLSPYLRRAAEGAGENTVTIAVDLEDVVDRTVLKMSLPSSPSVAKVKGLDVAPLATFLSGIKGLTFTARITDSITAKLTVEFTGEPTRYRKTLPDLVRELIEGQGIAISGFDTWEHEFTEHTFSLSGPLSTADLKRLVSLFAFPGPAGEGEPVAKSGTSSASATKRFLAAVDTILADIKGTRNNSNYEKTATWHDKAATQIEHLSKQGVDPVASDAAFEAAKRLRAIGASLRGVPIDLNALASQQYYWQRPSVGVMPGGWWGWRPFVYGPGRVDTNIPQIQSRMAKVVAEDQKRRLEMWSAIDRFIIEARRKLTEKYKGEF